MVRLAWLILLAGVVACGAAVVGEEVEYESDVATLHGYVAYDNSRAGRRPGILVVHEWWGQTEYVRHRARKLADLGYTALAVDMYGDGQVADHPQDAQTFSREIMSNIALAKGRFLAAWEVLKAHETVDPNNIAAIGYCFGGSVVLHMARMGVDINGVVSFHGALSTDTPAQPGEVKARILVCHGAADPFIPPEQVEAFKAEMERAGAKMKFISYEGASHSFTNPHADVMAEQFDMPIGYDAHADAKSWEDMQNFFKVIFAD